MIACNKLSNWVARTLTTTPLGGFDSKQQSILFGSYRTLTTTPRIGYNMMQKICQEHYLLWYNVITKIYPRHRFYKYVTNYLFHIINIVMKKSEIILKNSISMRYLSEGSSTQYTIV